MLIHNMEVCENYMTPIYNAESYLMETCNEYNINYDTFKCSPIIVNEGLLSKIAEFIKGIFQKAIAVLVKIWKNLINFCKYIVNTIRNFINRFKNKKSRPIKTKVSFITESFNITTKEVYNSDQLVAIYNKAMATISNRINKLSKENIDNVKLMEKEIKNTIVNTEASIVLNKLHSGDRQEYSKFSSGMVYDSNDTDMKTVSDKIDDFMSLNDGGVYPGDSFSYTMHKNELGLFKNSELKEILEADQSKIIELYNAYISGKIDEIARSTKKLIDEMDDRYNFIQLARQTEEMLMSDWIHMKRDPYLRDHESLCKRYLQNKYFPNFEIYPENERPTYIKRWLKLKINYNNGIINTLNAMIFNNSKIFNLTNEDVQILTDAINNQNMPKAREFMKKNIGLMLKYNNEVIDGRQFGLGTICVGKTLVHDDTYDRGYRGIFNVEVNVKFTDRIFMYLTRYDVTVITHGGYEEVNTSNGYTTKKYTQGMSTDGFSFDKNYIDEIGKPMDWICDPVITPDGKGPYTSMFDMLRQLIKDGYKRINVTACNGGHLLLPDDIRKSKGVIIQMNADKGLI